MNNPLSLPLDGFLYSVRHSFHVGTSGRGGKLLPPAANAASNASPGVNARRARHDFHPHNPDPTLSSENIGVEVARGNVTGVDLLRERGMRRHHRAEQSA